MTIQLSQTFRKAEIWTLYASWEQMLQQQSQKFSRLDTVDGALKIKELINTSKSAFFKQFFFREDLPAAARRSSMALGEKVDEKIEEVKKRIARLEQQLLNQISLSTHLSSAIIRLFTHNHYARTADFLVESQDQALSPYSNRLDAPYLKFSKTLAAGGLFALDLGQWRLLGFSQHLLTAISHQIMPSSEKWIPLFQLLNGDEKTALLCMPYLSGLFELFGFIGLSSYSQGFSLQTVTQVTLSYTIGLAASYASAKAVDGCYRLIYGNKPLQDIPTYSLVRGISQWVAFPLAVTQLLPLITSYLSTPQNVLADEATCFANKQECKIKARKVLGLPEDATLQDVKKAFHNLALDYHPDRNPSSREMYRQMAEAKKYCIDLESV